MIKAIIFDFGRTLHKQEEDQLYPGAIELLDFLKNKNLKLAVVSRTADLEKRREDFKRFDLEKYFDHIQIFPKDGTKDFSEVIKKLKVLPNECVIVGDRIKSEIVEGNKVGILTVWLRQGKFADELPENELETPNYTVTTLEEAKSLLEKLVLE